MRQQRLEHFGLARVQVEGNPDSLQAIVDDLAIETLRALVESGVEVVPRADLAGVTTHSLDALTAYLEGESRFRRGDFEAAYYAFNRALSADSTFALAHYRIANVLSWNELPGVGAHPRPIAEGRCEVEGDAHG